MNGKSIETRITRLECEVRDLKTRVTRLDGQRALGHDPKLPKV